MTVLFLINTIFAFITEYLIYLLVKLNFRPQIKIIKSLSFIICAGLTNGIFSTLWMHTFNIPNYLQFIKPIILMLINVVITKYFLKLEWLKSIIAYGIVSIFIGIANFIAPLFFFALKINATPEVVNSNIILYIFVNILIFSITFLLVKLIPFTKKLSSITKKPVVFLIIITIFILALNIGIHFVIDFNLISFISVLISSLAYFAFTIWYISGYHRQEMKTEEQCQQAFYNESLSNVIHGLRRFKHDHVNHLIVMDTMLNANRVAETKSYLHEILESKITEPGEIFNTTALENIKNAGLFGILFTKIEKAQKLGIKFDLKVIGIVDAIPNIRISELCEILGIYLDNAIEEVTNNKLAIEMKIINTDEYISIRIDNECVSPPDMTKSDKGIDRGNGLIIAKRIIDQYKNVFNSSFFENNNMIFSQILDIKKEA